MLALVDGDYKFIWADIGVNGCTSDALMFTDSELRDDIDDGMIGFPKPDPLCSDDQDMPYFIIGDDAFPLWTWMMTPFGHTHLLEPEIIFNRLSRAKQIV